MLSLRNLGISVLVALPAFGCGEDDKLSSPSTPGSKIAFVSTRDGNHEIYTINVDGTGLTRLTHDAAIDDFPTWSPDGQHIAFQSDRGGTLQIYVMNADGSNLVQRTFASVSEHPTWSAQGDTLAYSSLSDGSMNIWKVGAFSGSPTLWYDAGGYDVQPDWSPNSARVTFSSDWYMYDFVRDIFVVNTDGTGFTPLTGSPSDSLDYAQPTWSPDGSRLSMSISPTDTTGVLGVMSQDGSNLIHLAPAAFETRSSWSPDGQRIVYTSPTKDVVSIKADGSSPDTVITNAWNADWHP